MTTSTIDGATETINDHTVAATGQVVMTVEGNLGDGKIELKWRKNKPEFQPFNDCDAIFRGPGYVVMTAVAGTIIRPFRDGGLLHMAVSIEVTG